MAWVCLILSKQQKCQDILGSTMWIVIFPMHHRFQSMRRPYSKRLNNRWMAIWKIMTICLLIFKIWNQQNKKLNKKNQGLIYHHTFKVCQIISDLYSVISNSKTWRLLLRPSRHHRAFSTRTLSHLKHLSHSKLQKSVTNSWQNLNSSHTLASLPLSLTW